MMEIREKTSTDASQIAQITLLATAELRRIYIPTAAQKQSQDKPITPNTTCLVACKEQIIVGLTEYIVLADELHVRGLAVHPEYRRQGIARALIQAVAQLAIRMKKGKISISTIKETGNLAIFTRLGFHLDKETIAIGFQHVDGHHVSRVDMRRYIDDMGETAHVRENPYL